MRVLVVDDSKTMRRMIIKHLKQLGIPGIVEAADGREAIQEIVRLRKARSKLDLILTDWNMPTMTGLEFVKAVRQNGALKVPIIMITTNNTKQDVLAAIEAGIEGYITKPFTAETLRGKIIETLKKYHGLP